MTSRTPLLIMAVCCLLPLVMASLTDTARYQYYSVQQKSGNSFVDITARAKTATFDQSDTTKGQYFKVDLSFSFLFYGFPTKTLYISPYGFVSLYQQTCSANNFCNWNLGSTSAYTQIIAPFLTAFDVFQNPSSKVYYLDQNDGTNQFFFVQWTGMVLTKTADSLNPPKDTFTFQLLIRGNGDIEFRYSAVPFDPTGLRLSTKTSEEFSLAIGLQNTGTFSDGAQTVIAPFLPLNVNFNFAKQLNTIVFTAQPNCGSLKNCDSCVNNEGLSGIKCGWCASSSECMNAVSRPVSSNQLACPNVSDLQKDKCSALSGGAIAGIVIGVVVGVLILVFLICFCVRRHAPAAVAHKGYEPRKEESGPSRNTQLETVDRPAAIELDDDNLVPPRIRPNNPISSDSDNAHPPASAPPQSHRRVPSI